MFRAEEYMQQLIEALKVSFVDRLIYVGLQGSYMRGEATEDSDIDPMVVIEGLSVSDLNVYKQIITKMEQPEKSCGFLCGKQDLISWNPLEICHLLHTTRDYYGKLAEFVPEYTDSDVRNFLKMSVNNLYHEITHRFVHASQETNQSRISVSYKAVFYILQNVYYLENRVFVPTKAELAERLSGIDHEVLLTAISLSRGDRFEFEPVFSLLHEWCRKTCKRVEFCGER